ncbi:hypothetical protein [Mycobacterium sp. ENV421]|uniref:hypothetical protein n=1 Tax=unclassified Mycobacterium TaxID=2642494 RepID=UPI001E319027|nr:hypothetical protein [Mycobacterium sp. ENV421]
MTASNATETNPEKAPRARLWTNWLLALSTLVGAGVVQLFAMGAVMGTAACSNPNCPKPSGFVYGLLTYGAPVIAVLAVVITIFTAKHPRGWVVPVAAWVLLIVDIAILFATFS